jgi:hypothetical protein
MRIKVLCITSLAAMMAFVVVAQARIKLATLPQRERVEIRLDNPGYTLVEEERIVPLLQGTNKVDFSWSNTTIDKGSIQFRTIAVRQGKNFRPMKMTKNAEGKQIPEIRVINVAYPPGENALVWEVYADEACAAKVRVSYLVSNLTRSFSYRALADKDEEFLLLKKYLQVRNYSGEEFGDSGVWAGFGPKFQKEIGQQEDIKILMAKFAKVPISKTFTFDWYTYGALNADKPYASRILMHYELVNDEDNSMGQFPLQPGKVRIFIEDGRGGEAFLGEDWAKLTPLDDKMKLYLGESRDIVCTRTIESNHRTVIRGNLFNQEVVVKYEIENFKDKDATLRIDEQLNRLAQELGCNPHGDVEWTRGGKTSDEFTFEYERGGATPSLFVDIPARPTDPDEAVEKTTVYFHVIMKNLW